MLWTFQGFKKCNILKVFLNIKMINITNNLHVMWSGGVIDIRDGHDLVNVIFQSKHLNKIIAGLEMFGSFKDLY
jgi:hypothetical protein